MYLDVLLNVWMESTWITFWLSCSGHHKHPKYRSHRGSLFSKTQFASQKSSSIHQDLSLTFISWEIILSGKIWKVMEFPFCQLQWNESIAYLKKNGPSWLWYKVHMTSGQYLIYKLMWVWILFVTFSIYCIDWGSVLPVICHLPKTLCRKDSTSRTWSTNTLSKFRRYNKAGPGELVPLKILSKHQQGLHVLPSRFIQQVPSYATPRAWILLINSTFFVRVHIAHPWQQWRVIRCCLKLF